MSGGVPDGAVSGALVAEEASTGPSAVEAIASFPPEQAGMVVGGVATRVGGQPTVAAAGKPFLRPERILPKVIYNKLNKAGDSWVRYRMHVNV